MYYGLRKFTKNSQTFWGCDETDAGGVLGVVVDGVAFSGDTLSATLDYTGLVTATGLSLGLHTYQMTLDSALVGSQHTFTLAAAGDEVEILFIGDTNQHVDTCLGAITARESADAAFGAELYYMDSDPYSVGIVGGTDTNPTVGNEADMVACRDSVRAGYRAYYANESERLTMMQKFPMFNNPGNHDILAGVTGRTPGMVGYDGAHAALVEYSHNGMPEAGGVVDDEPNPVLYYSQVIGDVEVIVTDGLSYTNTHGAGDLLGSTSTTNAGSDAQVEWAKTKMLNSTANVIVFFVLTVPQNSADQGAIVNWIDANMTDKTVMFMVPNVHHSFARYNGGSAPNFPVPEFGCSPSGAVTSANIYWKNAANTLVFSDYHTMHTDLIADTVAASPVIQVKDTSLFRVGRKIQLKNGGNPLTVQSIDSINQITLTSVVGEIILVATGFPIHTVDWPDATDITNNTIGKRLLSYVRITRRPNGTGYDSNPHTEVRIINSITGVERFKCRIRDSEKTMRFYTSNGAAVSNTT